MGCLPTQKIRISTFRVLKIKLLSEIKGCSQEVFPFSILWRAVLLDGQCFRICLYRPEFKYIS